MPKPDHEPRTWCPQCGAVCTTETSEGFITFKHLKEATIGTYTEDEIVTVFAERKKFREALEDVLNDLHHQTAKITMAIKIHQALKP